jgi:hypothetical protein
MAAGSSKLIGYGGRVRGAGLRRLPIPLTLVAIGVLLASCGGHPFVHAADPDSIEITYGGSDIAGAWRLARQHCAQFGRVPRLVDRGLSIASFKCDPR